MAEVIYKTKTGMAMVEKIANPFLNNTALVSRDVETALLLEQAVVTDIGNAVAYTDGTTIYINIDDNLAKLLPAYDQRMLKWLLWHEKMHLELRHHNRFFKYLEELSEDDTEKELKISKSEVNIIMDILVHDSMSKMFPELVETALANLAQMRNRNSLKYTFKTFTLEEMLEEYAEHKKDEGSTPKPTDTDEPTEDEPTDTEDKIDTVTKSKKSTEPPTDTDEPTKKSKKGHGDGESEAPETKDKSKSEDGEPEEKDEEKGAEPSDEHDKTDWSKLEGIDDKEFITEEESENIKDAVNELKHKKFKLMKLTETLNGLVTSTRKRSYKMPSTIYTGGNILLKGSTPGRSQLYLVFDASGSMSGEMALFKEIISKSIPQAMDMPCEWFAGYDADPHGIEPYKRISGDGYYKGKFKNFIRVIANNGFDDDGDRTIELCWQAEQLGYSPIGVTDGGGSISWSKDKLKELKRTVLVGQNPYWLDRAKAINPKIQTLDIK